MRVTLGRGAGEVHWAYFDEDGNLIVEWYDYGDNAPYESANCLIFDDASQCELLQRIAGAEASAWPSDKQQLLSRLSERFGSWFALKEFATTQEIPFAKEVDFTP